MVATQVVEPALLPIETDYSKEIETPQTQLLKAIYILENGDPDYNLIPNYFHTPNNNYCVQGLLLELSGTGYWHQQSDYEWSNHYKFHDENARRLFSAKDYTGFIADYYSLLDNREYGPYLVIDESKLPEETRLAYLDIIKYANRADAMFGGYHLATINNIGFSANHPQIGKVLADILRYKAFV